MKILLGVTGSVAAKLTSKIQHALRVSGHEVKTVFTTPALNFYPWELSSNEYSDTNEWSYYKSCDKVLHIDLVKWADRFVIAPCTANTLSKIHVGICDNLVTSCVRAWPQNKHGIFLAPAMNCEMWSKKILDKQYEDMVNNGSYHWIPPQSKKLFCGDEGVGAMADIKDILNSVCSPTRQQAQS